jgi:hypothetical protein
MTYNVSVHLAIYLVAGLHVIAGFFVGGVYLRSLLSTPKAKRLKLHERHVVPAAFGWAAAVLAEAFSTLEDADLSLPVVWTDYVLLLGLISLGFAIAILYREKSFGQVTK